MISALLSYSNYLKLKEPLGAHKRFCLEAMEYTHVLFRDIYLIALRILIAIFMSIFVFVWLHQRSYCMLYILWLFIDLSFWEAMRRQKDHSCTFQPSVKIPLLVCLSSLRIGSLFQALCWMLKSHKPYKMRWDIWCYMKNMLTKPNFAEKYLKNFSLLYPKDGTLHSLDHRREFYLLSPEMVLF